MSSKAVVEKFPHEEKILALQQIREHSELRCRESLRRDRVKDYAELIREDGVRVLPLISVVWDEDQYCNLVVVPVWVYHMSLDEARFYAAAANRDHGVARTRNEVSRAIALALRSTHGQELLQKGVRAVARHVGCSHTMVSRVLRDMDCEAKACIDLPPKPIDHREPPALPPLEVSWEEPRPQRSETGASKAPPVAAAVSTAPATVEEPSCPGGLPLATALPEVQEVWRSLPQYDTFVAAVRKLRMELSDLLRDCPAAAELARSSQARRVQGVEKLVLPDVENLLERLAACRPAISDCAYRLQENHGSDCALCYGRGWVPQVRRHLVPEKQWQAIQQKRRLPQSLE
jgi:hypothetical protein